MSKQNPFGWDPANEPGGPDLSDLSSAFFEDLKARSNRDREEALGRASWKQRVPTIPSGLSIPADELAKALSALPRSSSAVSGFARQLEEAGAQMLETTARQERIAGGAFGLGAPSPDDSRAEQARLGLGQALGRAVETGLLTEERAVSMIVAGGINNEPMGRSDARLQLAQALAQAVASGALSTTAASSIAAIVEPEAVDPPRPSGEGSQGRSRPTAPPDDPDRLGALEEAVYEALTVRPCHRADHAERHRDGSDPCDAQAQGIASGLLSRLGLPKGVLPRRAHLAPDGSRMPCCARDGNLGTWLVYGRTLDPAAAFSGDRGPPDADPPS